MNRSSLKKFGRRKAGTWNRPRRGNKRVANKAIRRFPNHLDPETILPDAPFSGIAVLN